MFTNRKNLIEVKGSFAPPIKSIRQVMDESGRTRQYLDKQDLTWGRVLVDAKVGDGGVLVVIADDKYKYFIQCCQAIDKSRVLRKKQHKSK